MTDERSVRGAGAGVSVEEGAGLVGGEAMVGMSGVRARCDIGVGSGRLGWVEGGGEVVNMG